MPDQNVGHGPAEPSEPLLPLLLWICDCLGADLLPAQGKHTHHAATTKESRSVSLWARISMGSHGGQDSGSGAEFPLHLNLLQHTTSPHPIWVSILESEGKVARTQLSFVSASVLCPPLGCSPSLCVAHTIFYLSHHFI